MTWIIADEDEDEFLREIHSYPDRVVALLGQSIIDRRLETAIKGRWRNTGNIFESLFEPSGPLGSFSARIRIGFAISLYGKEAYNDLRRINRIRNAFAHKLHAKHFNTQSIRDHANALVLPSLYPISKEDIITTTVDEVHRERFMWDWFLNTLKHSFLSGDPIDPRSRFLRTVEILTVFLWQEDYINRSPGIPEGAMPKSPRF